MRPFSRPWCQCIVEARKEGTVCRGQQSRQTIIGQVIHGAIVVSFSENMSEHFPGQGIAGFFPILDKEYKGCFMDALKGNIFEILNGNKQFQIPVYQRHYSWEQEHCKRLWEDIVEMCQNNREAHFIGSIVNIAEQVMPTGVQKFMIVDGQQRITTLMLLLIALRDCALEPKDKLCRRIDNMLLKNEYEDGREQYKLLLTEQDDRIFTGLVDRLPAESSWKSSRIYRNYRLFCDDVRKGTLTPDQIYQSIGKLQIVNITLSRGVDDAQAIFESLNSTGKELSQSDLVRNYVLMGLEADEQNDIYRHLWKPMEDLFSYEKRDEYMDVFFRHYLTMKIRRIPRFDRVYDELKAYHARNRTLSMRALCEDMLKYAGYYTAILYNNRAEDETLKRLYADVNDLRMDVLFPFLMALQDDCTRGTITREELCSCIRLCLSYIVRRSVCNIPTNSLNKTFATLRNELNTKDYVVSLKAYLVQLKDYKRFPADKEFSSEFVKRDIYNMRNRNYILSSLENFDNKAPIRIENYTIEHIMPQNPNLSREWQNMLGSNWKTIQQTFLHTIGNLTLTAYNEKMSDSSFLRKRDMEGGFRESALRLNAYVVKQDRWDEERIRERAEILCEKARQIWEYPHLSEEQLAPYREKVIVITLDHYRINDEMMRLYRRLDNRIMNLSSAVHREYTTHYIAYKYDTNFVDVKVQKKQIKLYLNMKFAKVHDPKGLCRDITNIGAHGNGDVMVFLRNADEIDDIMKLILQSYSEQTGDLESAVY